jgi:hypothetical protein
MGAGTSSSFLMVGLYHCIVRIALPPTASLQALPARRLFSHEGREAAASRAERTGEPRS